MNRYSRSIQKVAAKPAHHYELRFFENEQKRTVQADDLATLQQKYTLEFLRRDDVVVVDMFASKPVLL